MPARVRAGGDRGDVAALGAAAAPRSTCRCPGRPRAARPAAAAGPPIRGGAMTVILIAFERRPARSVTVTEHGAGARAGGDAGDVADARAVELGRERAARPAERDAHALVDAAAADLELAADRHLDGGLAGRRGRRARSGSGSAPAACGGPRSPARARRARAAPRPRVQCQNVASPLGCQQR